MEVEQKSEYALGVCPKCGKTRTDVANGITKCCGTDVHAEGGAYASHDRKTMERYIHAQSAEEKIHFGRKLRLKGYEDL